jgi:hypothetical protein
MTQPGPAVPFGIPGPEWVEVAGFGGLPGQGSPRRVLDHWLRARGIDWMPFTPDEVLLWEP